MDEVFSNQYFNKYCVFNKKYVIIFKSVEIVHTDCIFVPNFPQNREHTAIHKRIRL